MVSKNMIQHRTKLPSRAAQPTHRFLIAWTTASLKDGVAAIVGMFPAMDIALLVEFTFFGKLVPGRRPIFMCGRLRRDTPLVLVQINVGVGVGVGLRRANPDLSKSLREVNITLLPSYPKVCVMYVLR